MRTEDKKREVKTLLKEFGVNGRIIQKHKFKKRGMMLTGFNGFLTGSRGGLLSIRK